MLLSLHVDNTNSLGIEDCARVLVLGGDNLYGRAGLRTHVFGVIGRISSITILSLAAGCGCGQDRNSTAVYVAAVQGRTVNGLVKSNEDQGANQYPNGNCLGAPDKPTEQELRAQETQLLARLRNRRRTFTDNRPSTEAEKSRDALQVRFDALKEEAGKIEAEMNSSTDKQRASALDQMRKMKGDISRCQNDLKSAEAVVKVADARREAIIANDPEIISLAKELASVRTELQTAR